METVDKNLSEEQTEALKEKLKNMSPEELKEFQKKQCIFCQIIAGKVQSKKIYEDDRCIAMLDINPANPGHIILMPKEHFMVMPQLPKEDLEHIFIVAKALSNAILKSLDVRGTNIIVANGLAAGQRAQHFMVHVIPRKENDGIVFSLPQKEIPDKDLDIIKEKLSKKLGLKEKIGVKKPLKKEILEVKEISKQSFETSETQGVSERLRNSEAISKSLSNKFDKKKKPSKRKTKKQKKDVNLDEIAKMLGKNEQ